MDDGFTFEKINDAKASMDHIYNEPDPRAYCRELKRVGYTIPDAAKPIFQNLIPRLRGGAGDSIRILDVGCSYGVNAALLKYDLSFQQLCEHWGQEHLSSAAQEEIVEADARYFSGLQAADDIEVIGLDVAGNAVAFAEEAGLLEKGIVVDLESDPLPDAAKDDLASVDLVTSTGCVGYVTEKSFSRLLPAVESGRKPWFANFVLRMFPFDDIEETLRDAGYVTEKLEGETFIQRAFTSVDEQHRVITQLLERGLDPTDLEAEGNLVAEFYLSRPEADATRHPLERMWHS